MNRPARIVPRAARVNKAFGLVHPSAQIYALRLCVLGLACVTRQAGAQCTPQWNASFPGLTTGPVLAMTTWDPDGAGPLPPVLVIGGAVNLAGPPGIHNILYWNAAASTWQPLGSGMGDGANIGSVHALIAYNGDLVAAGHFQTADGVAANSIARWTGSIAAGGWQPLGSGVMIGAGTGTAVALAVHDGDLIVGGNFFTAGGITGVGEIALWDGAAWHAMNNGFNSAVNAVASYGGSAYASGGFSAAVGGNFLSGIGRWAAPAGPWFSPGPGIAGLGTAMAVYNGELIVGGSGVATAGSNVPIGVVRWNGSAWGALGSGLTAGAVNALTVYDDGTGPNLIAGGSFITADGSSANRIARWNGSAWQPMGAGMNGDVNALSVYNGQLVAAGSFLLAGGLPASYVAGWGCACYANCDGSTTPPTLNVLDFACFLNKFAAGDPNANCDSSTTPPVLNVLDFSCFLNKFAAGCP